MAAAAILDFQFLLIWPLRRVYSVVFVFCIKFGSNSYSHWDRRTYASDLHFMTSRELTSGFDFWSRGHLCMPVVHLPMKFGADIFIQSGVIDIFRKLKMVAAAILDLFGWAMGPPTKPHSWRVPLIKNCHDRLGSFQVIRIWIFSRSGLKVLFTARKFQFLGDFTPKIQGHIVWTPKRHFLERNDAFWALIGPDRTHSATCGLGKETEKRKKKRQWQTGYLPRPPTSP